MNPPDDNAPDGAPDPAEPRKSISRRDAVLTGVYVSGFMATLLWYVVRGFQGCQIRTLFGQCVDFGLMVEAGFYALIWPLHWLLELFGVFSGGGGKPGG